MTLREILAATMASFLVLALALGAPAAPAPDQRNSAGAVELPKAFKGQLPITELSEDEATMHALNRLAYGPRPGELERVRKMGLERWIDQQLNPQTIDDSAMQPRLEEYKTLKMSAEALLTKYPPRGLLVKQEGMTKEQVQALYAQKVVDAQEKIAEEGNMDPARMELAARQGPGRITMEQSLAKIDRAIYSERQLNEVMADFWFNHFNVYANKGPVKWMVPAYEREAIRPNVMGKFQDLLLATAKSPAMLFYLDNWLSVDPDAFKNAQGGMGQRRARFNGGFGQGTNAAAGKTQERGINENYGREVMELHTVGVDGGYTQQDVIEMAKCLTGWTIKEPRRNPRFYYNDGFHTQGAKTVLGHKFNYGGMKDGEEALKMLARQPATAKFISTEMARHFVMDDPPPALVGRMAQSFQESGGDTRAVLRTMIYSPEFWSRAAYRAKVKTPFQLVVSATRSLGAQVTVPTELNVWIGRMGQPLYQAQPPTGYTDKSEVWVNTGALLNRLNFGMAISANRILGAATNLDALLGHDASPDPSLVLSRALHVFLGGQVSAGTRSVLEKHLKDPQVLEARLDDPVKHVNEGMIAGLVLGSPEFQRR